MTAVRRCRAEEENLFLQSFLIFSQANDKNCFKTGFQRMEIAHLRTQGEGEIIQFVPTYNLLMTWQVHQILEQCNGKENANYEWENVAQEQKKIMII